MHGAECPSRKANPSIIYRSSILISWFRLAGEHTFHQDTGRGINGLDLFPMTDDAMFQVPSENVADAVQSDFTV